MSLTASWKNKIIDYSKIILSIKSLNSYWHALLCKVFMRSWQYWSPLKCIRLSHWSSRWSVLQWEYVFEMTKEWHGRYQQQQPARPKSCNIVAPSQQLGKCCNRNPWRRHWSSCQRQEQNCNDFESCDRRRHQIILLQPLNSSMLKGFGFIFFVFYCCYRFFFYTDKL